MGAWTGGAEMCQNEWSVDFCGLDTTMAGCVGGRGSEGIGDAWGCCRCARKSLCTVFSARAVSMIYVWLWGGKVQSYRGWRARRGDCRGPVCACDCPSRCFSRGGRVRSPSRWFVVRLRCPCPLRCRIECMVRVTERPVSRRSLRWRSMLEKRRRNVCA